MGQGTEGSGRGAGAQPRSVQPCSWLHVAADHSVVPACLSSATEAAWVLLEVGKTPCKLPEHRHRNPGMCNTQMRGDSKRQLQWRMLLPWNLLPLPCCSFQISLDK